MAVTYAGRGATTAVGGYWFGSGGGIRSLTQTVTVPSGITAGDFLFLTLYGFMKDTNSDGSFSGVPAGWTRIVNITSPNRTTYATTGPDRFELWFRVADGSETDLTITGGGSFEGLTLSGGGRTQWAGEILRFTGISGHSLLDLQTQSLNNVGSSYLVDLDPFPGGYAGLYVLVGMASTPGITLGDLDVEFDDATGAGATRLLFVPFLGTADLAGGVANPELTANLNIQAATFAIARSVAGWSVGQVKF